MINAEPRRTPHLFVDISSHGLGHLAQTAPILNELCQLLPDLRLTVRSGLPLARLRGRISGEFAHLEGRSDFGFVMHDAVRIDLAATAKAYREQHDDWAQRVTEEAELIKALAPDLVLTDVAYLPLAGAAQAGIPALAMCSLNWAELFAHFYGAEAWAAPIYAQMLAAYRSAECFLRLTPAMQMSALSRQRNIAPVAMPARDCRAELRAQLVCAPQEKLVLVAFGGFDLDLSIENWPANAGLRWLIPQSWPLTRADMSAFEPLGLAFSDLLRSVDAVLTKPGYGTFTEAACGGIPVLYLRREDWPEQDALIAWLHANARCAQIDPTGLADGRVHAQLEALWQQAPCAAPEPSGAREAALIIRHSLERP